MNLAHSLFTLRTAAGFTQQIASKKTGVTQTFLSQLERGVKINPSMETLNKIAKGYGVSAVVILFLATEVTDIPKQKKQYFEKIYPLINEMVNGLLK